MPPENTVSEMQEMCRYQKHENGIHEFIIRNFSRAGVDAFVNAFIDMCVAVQHDKSAPIMVDGQGGSQPVKYVIDRMRGLKVPAVVRHSRVAVIREDNVVNNLVAGLMSYFPRTPVRFFTPDQREKAISWLLQT